MIVYFADRKFNIKGMAATSLPQGFVIVDDNKIEDTDTGVAVFECVIAFDAKTRVDVEACTEVGNYVLRKYDGKNEFYTIIDAEIDTKAQEVTIYAEDAGLDLLNEVVGPYEADKAYPIAHYIEKFAYDSGFVIGVNEIKSRTRKLSWDGESTKTERIASVATQFGSCEISYSFDVNGLQITNKYINIYKKRGQELGLQLRLNKEVDRIVTTKTIANLATGLECVGGTPETEGEDEAQPITLKGYSYDDGDFYVSGTKLLSRKALKKWSRYRWDKEPNKTKASGHIIRSFSYDTTSQQTLCAKAKTELQRICDMEVNYEVDIHELDAHIGDRVNIIDDAGGLYLSTRILKLETSVVNQTKTATLGEHLIKNDGISQKLSDLAAEFAATAQISTRAYKLAENANLAATEAQAQADTALQNANNALTEAETAQGVASNAQESANLATEKANAAQEAVDVVEESVESIEKTVENANAAAQQAVEAAELATEKADEAKTASQNAETLADEAKTQAQTASQTAQNAETKAGNAVNSANEAKTQAATASQTAANAKADAEQAEKDVAALGETLETVKTTMQADYARKTELTETEAHLQTQITQNADTISSHASQLVIIDETANNAAEQAAQAQETAAAAQQAANDATAEAEAAQTAANNAATAAQQAQTEADNAKAAAETAKGVADKAAEDLANAEADLATVQGRVDATEEEIAAAQTAVDIAKQAADAAKADAETAQTTASAAQSTADKAKTDAENAQTTADDAKDKATIAQAAADKAQGDATAAQNKADEAAGAASAAQATADTAVQNAQAAQDKADEAAANAQAAQTAADEADEKARQAQSDLDTAKTNLANVTSRVGATEEEVAAAQAAVEVAQTAADKAKEDAKAAQSTADTAKGNAKTAQDAADEAQRAADLAQDAADEAQRAADKAQEDVDFLEIRVRTAETDIIQNAEQIALMATRTEVAETLGGYYTKEETDAEIELTADSITNTVSSRIEAIKVGGRNLIATSKENNGWVSTQGQVVEDASYRVSDYIETSEGEIFTFQMWNSNGANLWHSPAWYDAEQAYIGGYENVYSTEAIIERQYTAPANAKYLRMSYSANVNVKLEKGNKATDWTAALEDVDGKISDAQSDADSALGRISIAESTIQQLADAISMLVTDENGTTLFEQTSEGWSFNFADALKKLDAANKTLTDMSETIGETPEGKTVNKLISDLEALITDVRERTAYIDMGTDGNGNPQLELGLRNDASGFKTVITNSAIEFKYGETVPMRLVVDTDGVSYVAVDKIKVDEELQHGKFVWVIHGAGNLGLTKKGVS